MARFAYRAYDASGALSAGEITAPSRSGALELLHRRGEHPIEVREALVSGARDLPWWRRDLGRRTTLPPQSLALFTRELATLVKADLPLDEALRILALQPIGGARARATTEAVLAAVTEGSALSEALAATRAFPDYHWRLVAAGEAAGALPSVLDNLATFLERMADARQKVGSALLYPVILLAAAVVTLGVVMGILVPAMLPLYEGSGTPPPAVIAVLAAAGAWVSDNGLMLLTAAGAAAVALTALASSGAFRAWRDRALLALPVLGPIIRRRETARLTRTLATLLRNGVPLVIAVETAAGAVSNAPIAAAVVTARDAIVEGSSLTAPLAASGQFSELMLRLVAAGEQTGQLDTMLDRAADIDERLVEQQLQRVTSLLTPALTIVVGLAVGAVVVTIMDALAGLNDLAIR